ncbi:hypothetical protein HN371_02450 [Candidatus Poribacteria bacterium]|nr:hypothetical protein [Candidatus Poribacteria bacterium]MBT5532934.1 hypothetical protein [Candidatus Poribacteria bacterium]MBT5711213.1 hypothetical protein [Candidatus Poribacteria bacterium]MBT7098242.1 hypothetical protein [Candidatus Poribacteria bacterium]MBT7806523.1 hypothetical protein [Candidatus Poribacteria bacterium]
MDTEYRRENEEVTGDEVLTALGGDHVRVTFLGCRIVGDVDLETNGDLGFGLGGAAERVAMPAYVGFIGCAFTGRVNFACADFPDADFESGRFEQKADFRGTRFGGTAGFSSTEFTDVDFSRASFVGAMFEDTRYSAQARFCGAEFAQSVGFTVAKFHGPADFGGARFDAAEFFCAEFHGDVGFAGCQFAGEAGFSRTQFAHAVTFRDTEFHGAVDFREARLPRGADLTSLPAGVHLLADQLAGSDLAGVQLPPDLACFDGLKAVEDTSKNARKIWLTMLLGCVYTWLTIATTKDVQLITNSASSQLPIIRTAIPLVGFYAAAPVLLLGLYLYFHLYMQHLWRELALLPARFPDGRWLDQKAYPWMLNGLVRSHVRLLREGRPEHAWIQSLVSGVLAWWVVPGTLAWLWYRYLVRHDWVVTGIHVAAVAASTGVGLWAWGLFRRVLRGGDDAARWKRLATASAWLRRPLGSLTTAVATLLVACGCSFRFIEVCPRPANLVGVDISGRPRDWSVMMYTYNVAASGADGRGSRAESARPGDVLRAALSNVTAIDLGEAHLERADAQGAFLVKADLTGAILRGADLRRAELIWANLRRADLREARLDGADMGGADLRGAQLAGVRGWREIGDIAGANLKDVRDAPPGFVEWACEHGAVAKTDREWRVYVHDYYRETEAALSPEE